MTSADEAHQRIAASAGKDSPGAFRNYPEAFLRTCTRFPDRVAVQMERDGQEEAVCFSELAAWSARTAAWLEAEGIGAGDRVGILADNDPRWVACYLGILARGAVAVPLDTAYRPSQVAKLVAQSEARVLFTVPRYLATAREASRQEPWSARIALLTGHEEATPSLSDAFVREARDPLPVCPSERSDAAVILYTSGTTSDPKGVVLTHGNLLAEFEAVVQVVPISEKDAVLGVLPLFHALAQMANLLLPLAVGARVVYLETVGTAELLGALASRGISIFACVPQFFYLIHQRVLEKTAHSRGRRRLFRALLAVSGAARCLGVPLGRLLFAPVHRAFGPQMRLLITGGSRFEPSVARDLWAMGFTLLDAYGLTETSGAATLVRPGERVFGSVGRPFPGTEVRIAPRENPESAAETGGRPQDGEILIRGPLVMAGYFNRPDATAAALRDGWFYSGDLGYLDAKGRLWITGRLKEIIITSSGKNIYPEEIEAHYLQSPFLKEICVVPARRHGAPAAERLHAVIVPDMDHARARKVLNVGSAIRFELETLSAQLPAQKRILSYDLWMDALPRTTTRKLKRFEIERRVAEKAPQAGLPETRAPTPDAADELEWAAQPFVAQALAVVRSSLSEPDTLLRPDANLELDLGLDSMERVELLTRLEERFGVRVPEETAHRIYTLRELVEALRESGGEPGVPSNVPGEDAWARLLAPESATHPSLRVLEQASWGRVVLFYLVMRCVYLFWRVAGALRVSGQEHLVAPGDHGFLLCPNHQSYLDAFIFVSTLPFSVFRRLFFVGASEYFSGPLTRRLARLIRLVPVDPDAHLVNAMQAGAYGLRKGLVLVLFPEGERSIDGTLKAFRKGAAILAFHTQSPIVPAAIEGAFDLWPRGRGMRWGRLIPGRTRLRVALGPPLPPAAARAGAEPGYGEATANLRAAVVKLWDDLATRRPARTP